jgi:hypothetical protein
MTHARIAEPWLLRGTPMVPPATTLGVPYARGMCRSIKTLRRPEEPPTDDEVRAAALQFVRKISGYRVPSRKNEEAFNSAVEEIAHASRHLLEAVGAELAA